MSFIMDNVQRAGCHHSNARGCPLMAVQYKGLVRDTVLRKWRVYECVQWRKGDNRVMRV